MNITQLTIYDILGKSALHDRIKKITNCTDSLVIDACVNSIINFASMPKDQKYVLAFSGGKDSHLLLAIYILFLKLGYDSLNVTVGFADTELEHPSLYQSIYAAQAYCDHNNIPFEIVRGKRSYWNMQFKLGYPVPNFRNRWCTGKLKIEPFHPSKKIKAITGRHLGESVLRDKKLKTCGSDTCGTDLIKDKYDPLLHWSNCLVWDALFHFDGILIYENCFDQLQEQYKVAKDSKTGSLRLGCFMCPVISLNTIEKNLNNGLIDREAYNIRLLLEDLRQCRRINNERTQNKGAIYVYDRRMIWQRLNKDYLLERNYITQADIDDISQSLESDYCYPVTYRKDWIDLEHQKIKKFSVQ